MSVYLLILVIALLVAAAVGAIMYVNRRARRQKISEMLAGKDLLAHWTYTPAEWRKAVEDEFTWVRNENDVGQVYISPTAICMKSGSQERLIYLSGYDKMVTHASYRGTEGSPLKLRVRWRVVKSDSDGPTQYDYFKEDYRIPVPFKHKEDAGRVAQFFTAQLENNLEAYATLMPDDEPISLFGKDSF